MAEKKSVKKTLSGTVTGVFFNEVDEDKHGNTIRPAISIDKKYRVTLGHRKDENLKIQVGREWVPLEKGAKVTVECDAYQNEKGFVYYSKVSKITLGSSGSSSSSSSSSGSSKSYSSGGSKPSNDEYTAGISSGHAVTNAINFLTANSKDKTLDFSKVEELAVDIAGVTARVKQRIMNGDSKPATKSKAKDPVEDFLEEDTLEEESEEEDEVTSEDDDSPF